MGRRTEIGFEAVHPRASGRTTAKLSRPKGGGVYPAAVQRRSCLLPEEISPCARKGDASRRSEKSAEAVVAEQKPEGSHSPRIPEVFTSVKGRTERRAKRP